MMRHFCSRQFLAFLLTGGLAAAVNFGSRIYYMRWLDFSAAVIAAYVTGMITAFVLARVFVFRRSTQTLHRSVLFFTLVNLAAAVQTWGISMGMLHYALPALLALHLPETPELGAVLYSARGFDHEIAHACGVAAPVFTSYLGHKRWSFRTGTA